MKPETTFFDVAGKKTQLTKGGSGPPLLYLHSAGGETEWMPFHAALAERFTLYLPAHPGFALSEGLDAVRDIDDYAWHYVDLLEQLGLGPLPVVGFSLGGWTALELALRRPRLVSRMVLVASAGLRIEGAPVGELFDDDLDALRTMLFFDPQGPLVDLALPRSLADERILLWLKAREATARVGWNPYLHNPRLEAHLRRVECPVRVLWGREDRLIPLAHGQRLAERLPQAELRVFERCGHMLPFEYPQEFARAVGEFLAETAETRR
jgi:pimeloyl-ACP methyl ester carboxylesterase